MGLSSRPPGPKGGFLLGNLPELRRDALGLYTRAAREFGDCVLLRYGWKHVWMLSHPDLVEQVLHGRNFIKHYGLRMNRLLFGDGLLTSSGDFWLRQRRLVQPAFLRDRLPAYAGTMVERARRLADGWQDGARCDVSSDLRGLALEIAAEALFGADASGQGPVVHEALMEVMASFDNRIYSFFPLPEWVPTPANLRARRAVQRLDALLFRMIRERRADDRGDLLSLLLRARDEQGAGMTDRQLRDEAMTLFLAGHDTTALTLTWAWYLLARHPEVMAELQAELHSVLAGRDPTADDLARLPFTEMVIQEVMRVYPPAYIIGRQAVEPCELGGYALPAGGTVVMPQWVVHRDPRWWDDPERFFPGRWRSRPLERLPKYAYFPFGGGPRVCVGNGFALMESVLVLATLARRFRMELVQSAPVPLRPRITLAPGAPVEVVLRRIG